MTPFACIASDCPWRFGDKLPGEFRGAAKNYSVMTVDELCRLRLPPIADDAYLFQWRVGAMQEEALRVCRAWNFTVKCDLVWRKLTKTGKPWFGMGRHFRADHETCLVAVRGRPQRLVANLRASFEAKVPVDKEGRYLHSAKPDEFYAIVEKFCAGPRVELFARRHRPGWLGLGNELGTTLQVAGA